MPTTALSEVGAWFEAVGVGLVAWTADRQQVSRMQVRVPFAGSVEYEIINKINLFFQLEIEAQIVDGRSDIGWLVWRLVLGPFFYEYP